MVRDIHPMGIFFVETKVDDSIVASVIHSIGFVLLKKKFSSFGWSKWGLGLFAGTQI